VGREEEEGAVFLLFAKHLYLSVQPCIHVIFKFVSAQQLWFWKSGVAYNQVIRQWSSLSVIINFCAFCLWFWNGI